MERVFCRKGLIEECRRLAWAPAVIVTERLASKSRGARNN